MTPEEGKLFVDVLAVLETHGQLIGEIINQMPHYFGAGDLAKLQTTVNTIATMKDAAMTPIAFSQEGVRTTEEDNL